MVIPAAGAAAVGVVGDDGIGDGMQCSEHPQYYNQRANPGGICALCLQEKLGRLVSSSPNNNNSSPPHLFYPSALTAPPYSSDSPASPPSSILVEAAPTRSGTNSSSSATCTSGGHRRASLGNRAGSGARSRMIPFLYTNHGRKKKPSGSSGGSSNTTNRITSSAVSRKVTSSTTSSSLSVISTTASSSSGSSGGNPVFKRSKSVAPRPTAGFPDGCRTGGAITKNPEKFVDSPRKKSFWSFLYLYSSQQNHHHHHSSSPRSTITTSHHKGGGGCGGSSKDANGSMRATTSFTSAASTAYIRDIKLLPQPPQLPVISTVPTASATGSHNKPQEDAKCPKRDYPPGVATEVGAAAATTAVRVEEAGDSPGSGSQASASFGRKVARSRSVGCGSRSFSGDFLERISTVGFGDCTLRRVESQREAKNGKVASHHHRPASGEEEEDQVLPPQRVVRCGGLFAGFYSSSSSYWLSDEVGSGNSGASTGRISTAAAGDGGGDSGTPHSRRSWAWAAFASPMRAFRPSSSYKQESAVASVNVVTRAAGRSASSTTTASGATTRGGAALLSVKG